MDTAFELKPNELGSVPLTLIDPDPDQPRKDFDDDYITELAESIKHDGVIQPIVVRSNPDQAGRFYIVAGENRWRASCQAKTKTIPAVLREVDGLTKLIIQLKENCQRKDLNPMEWALALRTMNKQHGLKQSDIEKTLKESGVTNLGRSYISNTIRLLDLPEWAQEMIRAGQLTAAHGKYLLPATASALVMEAIQAKLGSGWEPTTNDLQKQIYWSFSSNHIDLTNYRTSFDYREKCVATGCQKMRKVGGPLEGTFCLDQKCHAQHTAEERELQLERREAQACRQDERATQDIAVDADNKVDVNQQELSLIVDYRPLHDAPFDTANCTDCQHNHIAADDDEEYPACFDLDCYHDKHSSANRANFLVNRYLRTRAIERVRHSPETAVRLLAWLAADTPAGIGHNSSGDEYIESMWTRPLDIEDDDLQQLLFKHRLFSLGQFLDQSCDDELMEVALYAITNFHSTQLLELCKCLKVTIDDYRIDEAYLAEHTEEEITALLDSIEWAPCSLAERYNAENAGKIDQFVLDVRAEFGVPAEIRFAYERMIKEADDA